MADALILYWQPGSGGDTVQHLLSQQPGFGSIVKHWQFTDSGRTVPRLDRYFHQLFKAGSDGWYSRDWTHDDILQLVRYLQHRPEDLVIIPTHRPDQARHLANHVPRSKVLAVCFDHCLWPWVLTHWCHCFGAEDKNVSAYYDDALHQGLRTQGLFGVYLLQQQLRHGSRIITSAPVWDYNLNLGKLLLNDLSDIEHFLPDLYRAQESLASWNQKHSALYRWQWPAHPRLIEALGHNPVAPMQCDLDHELTSYEAALINHWCDQQGINRIPPGQRDLSSVNNIFENALSRANYTA